MSDFYASILVGVALAFGLVLSGAYLVAWVLP